MGGWDRRALENKAGGDLGLRHARPLIEELVVQVKLMRPTPRPHLSDPCDFFWTWIWLGQGPSLLGLSSPHRKLYEILSTFITSGMRFLLNQQVWAVAGLGDSEGALSFKGPDSSTHLPDLPSALPRRDGAAQLPAGHCAW